MLCWCGMRWRCCWGVQVRSRSVTEVRTGCSGKPRHGRILGIPGGRSPEGSDCETKERTVRTEAPRNQAGHMREDWGL